MAGRDHSDFNSLPERAGNARRAVDGLGRAFEELSRAGTSTAASVKAISNVLGAIPHPAAQAASLLVQFGASLLKASEASNRLSAARLDYNLNEIAAAADRAADSVRAFQSSMLAGETEAVAAVRANIDRIRRDQEQIQSTIRAQIQMARDSLGGYTRADIEPLQAKSKLYLDVANARIRAANAELEGLTADKKSAEYTRAVVNPLLAAEVFLLREKLHLLALEDSARARRAQMTFEEQMAEKGLAIDFAPSEEDTEAVYRFRNAVEETGQMVAYSFGQLGAEAFDVYYTALDRVIDGQNAFGKNAGRNYQNATADILRSLGREAAARAVMHLAMAAAGASGAPLSMTMYGTPAENLKAAALFGSVAAMAGVSAAALSTSSASGTGGRGSGAAAESGRSGGPTYNITVLGAPDFETKRTIRDWIASVESEGS